MLDGERPPATGRGRVRCRAKGSLFRGRSGTKGFAQRREQGARELRASEAWMAEEKEEKIKLPLKHSGELVDAEQAMYWVDDFRVMQELYPKRFKTVVALAQNLPEEADPKQVKALKDLRFVRDDGQLDPYFAGILTSSLEMRDNCYVLVQPFRLESERDKLIAERAANAPAGPVTTRLFGRDGSGRPGRS